ncbi:alpha-(1,3)-fucosyltransferase 10 [Halyomorpha halys]|uniref:alpha-(1,3)-fucosyltransferase 10 n=1 Tax=Halyomorpha halys TaxID=286706 RepID=UPI0006D4FB28|nr:alpha-(1,3)-fucosyltransferase 10 [Halyomorpha halys]
MQCAIKSVKIFPIFLFGLLLFFLLICVQLIVIEESSTEDIATSRENTTLIWWTPFTLDEKYIQCGDVHCFVTSDRHLKYRNNTVFLFYGTHFNASDLPSPRGNKIWGLLHEESPRNSPLLNHESILSLFNYSSTFSRFSDLPLTLQYLASLESLTSNVYYKTFEEKTLLNLSEVIYIQSDCVTPNNRDSYVNELMNYISIDSYGACLNNKKLPMSLTNGLETMMSPELLQLIGNYKFAISFENAVCEDYITEKLWRPLIVGTIPVYLGSPSIKDWLPNDNAAIFPFDFSSPKELADYLHFISSQREAYNKYLKHKIEQIIENELLIKQFHNYGYSDVNSIVNEFECMVCKKSASKKTGFVTKEHYNCPRPVSALSRKFNISNWWHTDYDRNKCEAAIVRNYIDNSLPINSRELENLVLKYLNEKMCDVPENYLFQALLTNT